MNDADDGQQRRCCGSTRRPISEPVLFEVPPPGTADRPGSSGICSSSMRTSPKSRASAQEDAVLGLPRMRGLRERIAGDQVARVGSRAARIRTAARDPLSLMGMRGAGERANRSGGWSDVRPPCGSARQRCSRDARHGRKCAAGWRGADRRQASFRSSSSPTPRSRLPGQTLRAWRTPSARERVARVPKNP